MVTPGSGATIATESVSSLEYEVMMTAEATGHIARGRNLWVGSQVGSIFPTGDHNLCALWNGAGSGVTLEVVQYLPNMEDASGNTFDDKNFPRIYRITAAPSAGTTSTPRAVRSTGATAIPAQVLFYGEGVTAVRTGDALTTMWVYGGPGGASMGMNNVVFGRGLAQLWESIVLAEGEGIVVHGGDNNNVAQTGSQLLYFVVR